MTLGPLAIQFSELFAGFDEAYGTGKGSWVEGAPSLEDFEGHLRGEGTGIGIAPLRKDGTVSFAAIDLDEPDFKAAAEMVNFLPGPAFIERSRSGNAHVWVFFKSPIKAWVPRGILKEACLAAGKRGVEIFPKQDGWNDALKFGNYINLPYHGTDRPIIENPAGYWAPDSVERFIERAAESLNEPEEWEKRARWLLIEPPSNRERSSEFGEQKELHICAEHIIAMRDDNPIMEGHRNAVFFALAKMLSNYEAFDHDEALHMMKLTNDASPDPLSLAELKRLLRNAEQGRWTSTDCDNPLVEPYTHPECPIRRNA